MSCRVRSRSGAYRKSLLMANSLSNVFASTLPLNLIKNYGLATIKSFDEKQFERFLILLGMSQ